MNYFELFDLPIQFRLDNALLSSKFRMLQKRFHPDKFVLASEQERLKSLQKALQINDAYQVLRYPLSRAEYLLLQNGFGINDRKMIQNPAFLIKQTELYEELEEVLLNPEGKDALLEFYRKVSKSYKQHLMLMEKELDAALWINAMESLKKLQFIAKFKSRIEQRIEDKSFGY
ncbi:co-chaperone protein [Candidatus Photodesmus blepharus]|uniref:Co-chaperone protein HscB homolog n=1 Tax=Candidatus Photodesmus blepharonis TaxID=1179155 RepID=A0A084CPG5_9GAMM|nr:Fe-S protein assembly co-chaperone HscB [Candidatus Photodesmus blepharus]KEY91694.1 co-chaperone protein [Candidatus Photodesmus blepharus]